MKRNAIWLAIFSQFLVCACIYDTPKGDIFYRTLWTSGEAPLGPITMEFLCEGNVSITCEGGIGSYGRYETYDQTAYFSSLRPQYYINNIKGLEEHTIQRISPEGLVTVVIEEAHRTDDLLLISWHFSESAISYTTRLVRQSTYEQLQK